MHFNSNKKKIKNKKLILIIIFIQNLYFKVYLAFVKVDIHVVL